MKTPPITAASIAALGLAAVLAGCGSGTEQASSDSASSQAAKTTKETTGTLKKGTAKREDADNNGIPDAITVKGKLGDTLALQGSGLNDGSSDHTKTRIRVTLKGVKGPFKGFDIAKGRQLIGVELHFVNVGKLVYDNPLPQGELTVASGENAKQTNLIAIGRKSPCDNPSVKLKAGQSKNVCIAFDVPKAEKPKSFQYVADHGFGDTGLWALR
jgi:hypothetical protein